MMLRPAPDLRLAFAAAALALAFATTTRALEVTEWKNRQSLIVEQPGVIKLALPPATLDLARPGLEDLRLLDPAGHEVPFIVEQPAPRASAAARPPKSFRPTLTENATQLLIETGTDEPLDSLVLFTPASGLIKAARVEISADGDTWRLVRTGALLFRQFGAEQSRIALDGQRAARLRITIDDARTPPVPFTGASVRLVPATPPVVTRPLEIRVLRREEFAGETLLTLDLGAAHVPLASLEFSTAEPLFARTLTITARELRGDTAAERTFATGSIYRIAADGLPPGARLDVPVDFTAPSRELFVHLANGDSPPLAIDRVLARQHPRWLVFRAAEPGVFTFLTGNPLAPAPRYDLAALASPLRETPPSALVLAPAEANPGYRRPETLADTPLLGAAIDLAPWTLRKPVLLAAPGVQTLELDLDVLSRAQPSLADLRLVRDGAQLPYLVERPALYRSFPLALTRADDPHHPSLSRWEIKLARAGLPFTHLTLTSATPLFRRHLRLFEQITDDRGGTYERALADAEWSKTPGHDVSLTLTLSSFPTTAVLTLETDNGDNAPLALATASAAHAVARLLFKTTPGPLALYYGHARAEAPRYDLSLVAAQIVTAEKSPATLGAEEPVRETAKATAFSGAHGGIIFWAALAFVVIALLVVVAKLLPKPPAA